jgi:hypothetical protein
MKQRGRCKRNREEGRQRKRSKKEVERNKNSCL